MDSGGPVGWKKDDPISDEPTLREMGDACVLPLTRGGTPSNTQVIPFVALCELPTLKGG